MNNKEEEYLHKLVFADKSLEQYEEHLSDHGEVEDLDEDCFTRDARTNDSFDSNENSNEKDN